MGNTSRVQEGQVVGKIQGVKKCSSRLCSWKTLGPQPRPPKPHFEGFKKFPIFKKPQLKKRHIFKNIKFLKTIKFSKKSKKIQIFKIVYFFKIV